MAERRVVKGVIKSIGAGSVYRGELTETSVLEIGDVVLENISYGNFIDTYLKKALESGTPIAIGMMAHERKDLRPRYFNEIIAVKMNGTVYKPQQGVVDTSVISWAIKMGGKEGCAVAVLSVGLFGIVLLLMGWFRASHLEGVQNKVLSELARTEV